MFNLDRIKVASTKATVEFLEYIPSEDIKQFLISIINENGLSFAEQDFVSQITKKFTEKELNKE